MRIRIICLKLALFANTIMENKTNDEMNLWSYYKGGWKNNALRWILGIVILIIVFSFGFKLGKFSALFSGGYYGTGSYGYPMMGGGYYRNNSNMMYPTNGYYGMGPWMMSGYYQGQNSQPQTLPPTLR